MYSKNGLCVVEKYDKSLKPGLIRKACDEILVRMNLLSQQQRIHANERFFSILGNHCYSFVSEL